MNFLACSARKILVISAGPFGCIPSRVPAGSKKGECVASDDEMAEGFNTTTQRDDTRAYWLLA